MLKKKLSVPDDSVVGLRSSDDTDAELEPDGCWSEGDKDDALVTYKMKEKLLLLRRGMKQKK